MNTAARALAHGGFSVESFFSQLVEQQLMVFVLLVSLVLTSAFAVIYEKDMNRRLFVDLQTLQSTRDRLHEEWGQLLLEQTTWATQSRIQHVAQERLDMVMPSSQDIKIVE